jgi:predicted RNA-binding Zn ribbon-like protein
VTFEGYEEPVGEYLFELIGGRRCLDFLNTVAGMRPDRPREHLLEYRDLLRWARTARLIDERQMTALLAEARRHPRRAAAALQSARELREALHDVVVAGIHGKEPPPQSLLLVNEWIASAMARRRLVAARGKYQLRWEERPGDLIGFLTPVALDAAEVLSRELPMVHVCGEADIGRCGWIFLDETKNHSRRYCVMRDCGNRAKQRRFRAVRRAT